MSPSAHSPNIARDADYTISRVLNDIKTATECISHATTQQYVNIRDVLSQCTEDSYLDIVVNTFSGYLKSRGAYGGRSNCFLQEHWRWFGIV